MNLKRRSIVISDQQHVAIEAFEDKINRLFEVKSNKKEESDLSLYHIIEDKLTKIRIEMQNAGNSFKKQNDSIKLRFETEIPDFSHLIFDEKQRRCKEDELVTENIRSISSACVDTLSKMSRQRLQFSEDRISDIKKVVYHTKKAIESLRNDREVVHDQIFKALSQTLDNTVI